MNIIDTSFLENSLAKPNYEVGYVLNDEPATSLGINREETFVHTHQKTRVRTFLAASFILTKPGDKLHAHAQENGSTMAYPHRGIVCSRKMNTLQLFVTTSKNFTHLTLSGRSKSHKKNMNSMILFT